MPDPVMSTPLMLDPSMFEATNTMSGGLGNPAAKPVKRQFMPMLGNGLDAALMGGNLGQIGAALGSMGSSDIASYFDRNPGFGMGLQQPRAARPTMPTTGIPGLPNYNVPNSFPGQVGVGIGPRGINIARGSKFAARR